jgi:hypothetical protein
VTDEGKRRPVVVFDTDIESFMSNRVLDLEFARQFPGAEAFAKLAERLDRCGVDMVTVDVFLASPGSWTRAACLSNETTRFTDELVHRHGVVPAICLSLESPVYATEFYSSIAEISKKFRHVFLWRGTRARATDGAEFHEISWPYPSLNAAAQTHSWGERRFLTLISSNKAAFPLPRPMLIARHPRQSVRNVAQASGTLAMRVREPFFRSELYSQRLKAIRHFSSCPDFDLFGRGWESAASRMSRRSADAVASSYRGEIPARGKLSTLSRYQFAVCFENTAFPGYITEKIFDCLVTECIPVYLGAPDIGEMIPPECFVDMRVMRSYSRLERYLRTMTESEVEGRLGAVRAFAQSARSARFTQERFVADLFAVLMSCLEPQVARS